ncbi:TIR domain-containing adapter molecule 1 [Clinocottus analis]|uniref:TIR domain-containing adapter molecule 1 n=1 Tax=Clinocottus analis TaxID=304258 RepID=UPI0035C0315D
MSHVGEEHQGTGLKDVFGILLKTPPERLLSLTFQLGESPEEHIVHALSLIILQKEERALDKLQRLKDNQLAAQLAEKWQSSGGNLEDFAVRCGHFQELAPESLALLARVFKVLSEQKLCDEFLRDLAYKRAVSSDGEKLEYDRLAEEARDVCGPQFAEWTRSSSGVQPAPQHDPLSGLDEGIQTLKVTLSQHPSESAYSLPSPLQVTPSMPSYPTHLEISVPPTALLKDDKVTLETSAESNLKSKPELLVSEREEQGAVGPRSSQPPPSDAKQHSKTDEACAAEGSQSDGLLTPNQPTEPTSALHSTLAALPTGPPAKEMQDGKDAEEEEAKFYAFVILHALEDEDMADGMREKIEAVIRSDGATFSVDFAIPGKSILSCVEDAINNSAFTLLLLTRNFNTRLLEMETDSALINSINNTHKYNTVIPLLPHENCMPRERLPLVLKTINSLEENKRFERRLKKVFTPLAIQKQRSIWNEEQTKKRETERQERRKSLTQKQRIKECHTAQLEEETRRVFLARNQDNGEGRVQWPQQQQPNIHIENAQCIIIGNDSQMNVELGGGADRDESEEEQ